VKPRAELPEVRARDRKRRRPSKQRALQLATRTAIRVHEQVSDGVAMASNALLDIGATAAATTPAACFSRPSSVKEPSSARVTCTAWCEWKDVFGYGGSPGRLPRAQRQSPLQNTMRHMPWLPSDLRPAYQTVEMPAPRRERADASGASVAMA